MRYFNYILLCLCLACVSCSDRKEEVTTPKGAEKRSREKVQTSVDHNWDTGERSSFGRRPKVGDRLLVRNSKFFGGKAKTVYSERPHLSPQVSRSRFVPLWKAKILSELEAELQTLFEKREEALVENRKSNSFNENNWSKTWEKHNGEKLREIRRRISTAKNKPYMEEPTSEDLEVVKEKLKEDEPVFSVEDLLIIEAELARLCRDSGKGIESLELLEDPEYIKMYRSYHYLSKAYGISKQPQTMILWPSAVFNEGIQP